MWQDNDHAAAARKTIAAREGFTLLELLLTLALAVVLIGLVGGAMRFYAVDMNVRDMDIRQTQLAAAVMQMIENDLRATLHGEPIDTSGLEALLAATAANVSGGGGGAQPAGSEEDLSAAGIDSEIDDGDAMIEQASTADLEAGTAVLQSPGLIGNQYQIQIDLSRLPRLEEYMAFLDQSVANIDDVPSDLKTVSYFVQPAGVVGGIQDPLSQIDAATGEQNALQQESVGGLVRRSLDRAATVYAASSGGAAMLNQTGELLAPEISGIEFGYWDGVTWQLEWSSDEFGELPLAVQVRLYMADPQTAITGEITDTSSTRTFMHVVRLPMARPIEEEETELLEAGI
jgi:prepilin-type N-terminal cleavage/methylation domain-containing protein